MGSIAIVLGFFATYFGGKWFLLIVMVIGGGVAFLCSMLLCSAIGMLDSLDGTGKGHAALTVLAFIISGAIGVGVGLLCKKLVRVGAAILGGAAGYFAGFTIYNFIIQSWLSYMLDQDKMFYILIGLTFGLAFVGAFICFRYYHRLIINLTAAIGSYVLVRGISVFGGHYPNEITTYSQLMNGAKPDFDNYTYIYFGGMLFCFVTGYIYQHRTKHQGEFFKVI